MELKIKIKQLKYNTELDCFYQNLLSYHCSIEAVLSFLCQTSQQNCLNFAESKKKKYR